MGVLQSRHVRGADSEPGVTAGHPVARELPRGRQGEKPHPGQPVALAEHRVDALARTLKGLSPKLDLSDAFEITRSLPHGHVAAVLGTARRLGIDDLLDSAPSRHRDL